MPPSKNSRMAVPAEHDAESVPMAKSRSTQGQARARGRAGNGVTTQSTKDTKEVVPPASEQDGKTTAAQTAIVNGVSTNEKQATNPWFTAPTPLLESYTLSHRLSTTPSAFSNPQATALFQYGIGKSSPTMLRPKSKRRIPKEQLAVAVRKDFNGLSVNETDVIVGLIYRVSNRDKALRLRFPATTKSGGGGGNARATAAASTAAATAAAASAGLGGGRVQVQNPR